MGKDLLIFRSEFFIKELFLLTVFMHCSENGRNLTHTIININCTGLILEQIYKILVSRFIVI